MFTEGRGQVSNRLWGDKVGQGGQVGNLSLGTAEDTTITACQCVHLVVVRVHPGLLQFAELSLPSVRFLFHRPRNMLQKMSSILNDLQDGLVNDEDGHILLLRNAGDRIEYFLEQIKLTSTKAFL